MSSDAPPVVIPSSYEKLPTRHIKLSHYPAGAENATPVVVVILNRPEKRNTFTSAMAEDLEQVFAMIDRDERVKVVVLTGAGNTFCAGADLEIGFPRGQDERPVDHRDRLVVCTYHSQPSCPMLKCHSGGRVALAIHRCRKPTIAAMQGSAVGVGMTMTLPAVIRYYPFS
jgi:enoyl-CoA hydratase/carnithine racemase